MLAAESHTPRRGAYRSALAAADLPHGNPRMQHPIMTSRNNTYSVFSTDSEQRLSDGNIEISESTNLADRKLIVGVSPNIPNV